MATLLEVLVTSDSNNTLWTNAVWDPNTGTSLITYKGGGTAENRTLSFIGKDYIAAVEKTKPVLHIWPLNSYQTVQGMRFILPGKATTLAVSANGDFIIAGIEEKIYLWQTASGNLLTIINRHYQKVVLLQFTPDGSYFISAGNDGMVMVWSLATVVAHSEVGVASQTSAGHHDPVYILPDHSLPVTDLCISKTGMHGKLCTVSSDRTCKIYDMSSGGLLLNLVFDTGLTAVTFDVLELNIFIGTSDGPIYEFSLTNPPRTRDLLVDTEEYFIFASHTYAVTCLSASLDGETLMSGSNDGQVILWHIRSKQPLRIIKHKGPVTNAFFTTNLPAIYKQDFTPEIILHSLERTLEKDTDDVYELEILVNRKINFWPDVAHQAIESNIPYTEAENEFKLKKKHLDSELNNLKTINHNLYTISVEKMLQSSKKNQKKKKNNDVQ